MLTLQAVARALQGEQTTNEVIAPGPGHSAKDRSLSVKLDSAAPDGFIVHSFAGDDPIACRDYVRERLSLPAFKPEARNGGSSESLLASAVASQRRETRAKIVATYDYTDADGVLLYEVLRYEPKNFRQRRPDGNGGWIWNLNERRVVYRWPELLKFPDATVFVCEGEKDADNVAALNLCATSVASWQVDRRMRAGACWPRRYNSRRQRRRRPQESTRRGDGITRHGENCPHRFAAGFA